MQNQKSIIAAIIALCAALGFTVTVITTPAPLPQTAPVEVVQPDISATPENGASSVVTLAKAGPDDLYPDPTQTPGVTNPDITQDTIAETLCNPNWSTKSIRPTASYTTALKVKQLAAGYTFLGDTKTADYEEDHFISLELGGSPTDPKNLWPEAYLSSAAGMGAKSKDTVENYLHKQLCSGQISLVAAQSLITHDWYAVYENITGMDGKPAVLGGAELDSSDQDDN